MRTLKKILIWTIIIWAVAGGTKEETYPVVDLPGGEEELSTPANPIDTTLIGKRDTTKYKGHYVTIDN